MAIPKVCICLSLFMISFTQAALYYRNFTTKLDGALYPLDPYGMSGRYAGLWSNYSNDGISTDISYQVWLLSYNAATPRSFFLALVGIRNPSKLWDLTKPVILWKPRQRRLVGENATLQFTDDGELKLEEDGDVVWSSGTRNRGVKWLGISNRATIMLLNEDGNKIIWQSSDEPSNTVLLQRALKTGDKLVSWNTLIDSSDGSYSLVVERNRLSLLYNSEPYWRLIGNETMDYAFAVFCWQANGTVSLDLRTNASQIETERDDSGLVFSGSCSRPNFQDQVLQLPVNGSRLTASTFIKIKPNGDVVLYSWTSGTDSVWIEYFSFSSLFKCFLPVGCGRYRFCSPSTGACNENCPVTFSRKGIDCEPLHPLETCMKNVDYGFVRQEGADYFSTNYTDPILVASEGECQARCQSSCNCTAAFFGERSCFLTHASVQSLRVGKYVALLKVAQPRNLSKSRTRSLQAITLGVLVPVLVLLIVCVVWQCCKRTKAADEDEGEEEMSLQLSLMPGMPRRFNYEELQQLTANFRDCLGTGGCGSVFRGRLLDGTEVAVKKLEGSVQRSKDFFDEVGILARTHHWNLVKLLGFCAQGPRKRLLVYEYMKNGSLEQWIFEDDVFSGRLPWKSRFGVALGTARGLSYLHNECAERIIHLDLKPENVLLDLAFLPKIADFGLSKLMDRKDNELRLTIMRGTPGYFAPECIQEGTVTEKSDVFSFGVLLLEIITGCKSRNLSGDYLKAYLLVAGSFDQESASPHLKNECKQRWRLRNIVALCIQDDPVLRPPMCQIIQMIEGVIDVPQLPLESQLQFFLAYRPKQHALLRQSESREEHAMDVTYRSINTLLSSSAYSLDAR